MVPNQKLLRLIALLLLVRLPIAIATPRNAGPPTPKIPSSPSGSNSASMTSGFYTVFTSAITSTPAKYPTKWQLMNSAPLPRPASMPVVPAARSPIQPKSVDEESSQAPTFNIKPKFPNKTIDVYGGEDPVTAVCRFNVNKAATHWRHRCGGGKKLNWYCWTRCPSFDRCCSGRMGYTISCHSQWPKPPGWEGPHSPRLSDKRHKDQLDWNGCRPLEEAKGSCSGEGDTRGNVPKRR